VTDFPDLKIRALVNFPSNAIGGTGVDVEKVNGNFVIDLAYDDFAPPVSGVLDPAHQNVLLWNSITQIYALTPISLFGGGGGIPDAPNDGVQYGRQSLAWTPVVAGSTVLPATTTPLVESGSGTVGTSVKYAREDHVHPASGGGGGGGGDVTGPASAVASRIATFSGTTGKIIQDSGSLTSDFATPASVTTAIGNAAVRYDVSQSLTTGQKQQAVTNVGLTGILDAWTAYTPTVTVTGGAGTATGRYKQIGKTMFISVFANVTAGGSALAISLPAGVTAVTGVNQYMVGRESTTTGNTWIGSIPSGSTVINAIKYDNNFPVTTGQTFGFSGMFEAA
jgi:hypothetical protein